MFGILFATLILIYAIMSGVIVYHLNSYTINKTQAKRAIAIFVAVMTVLTIIQIVLFFFLPANIVVGTANSVQVESNDTFY